MHSRKRGDARACIARRRRSSEGHARSNRGAVLRARINGQVTDDQLEPLFHAHKAETSWPFEDLIHLKTNPGITHGQRDVSCAVLQRHVDAMRAAVLDGILQRFLQNAIQAQRNLLRQVSGVTFLLEMNLEAVPLGHLATKTECRRRKAYHQLWGMQAMGKTPPAA